MKIATFLSYLVFDKLYYFKKPWNLRVFPLDNIWWVDIHRTLTICLFCTRCEKERQRKVNLQYENWMSYMQRFSFSLIYSNTQFRTKRTCSINLARIRAVDCRYCYTEAFKTAHARKTCLCLLYECVKLIVWHFGIVCLLVHINRTAIWGYITTSNSASCIAAFSLFLP